jgi:hypothetical protein
MRALQGGSSHAHIVSPAQSTASANSSVAAGGPSEPPEQQQQPEQQDASAAGSTNTAVLPSLNTPDVPPQNLEPKALFQYLVNYLEVNPEQAAALKDSRWVAQEMDGCLSKSMQVLQELRERLTQIGDDLETEFDNVRAILTPTQAAKFLVWVANNRACMHMLNELWSRSHPVQASEQGKGEPQQPQQPPPPQQEK